MITASNTDVIAKQLEDFSKEVERKLKSMVQDFAVEVLDVASENTRLGDSITYADYYKRRQKETGWLPEEGMAKGGWVIALDGTPAFVERHGQNTTEEAVDEAMQDVQGYKLGQSFVIGNAVPYTGQFAMEIKAPTVSQITTIIEADLKKYYDLG